MILGDPSREIVNVFDIVVIASDGRQTYRGAGPSNHLIADWGQK